MDIFTIIAPAIGFILPYITQFAKNKFGMDGKKVIVFLSIFCALGLHIAQTFAGEAAVMEFIQNAAQMAAVAMTYYNFFMKKTETTKQ